MVQRLTPEGALAPECHDDPGMTDQQLLYAFRVMIQSRAIDEWAVSLTRQGRLLPYPPAVGQEANSVGGAMAVRDDDWIVYAYRELGALLVRGLPITAHFQYWYGIEEGSRLDIDRYHLAPVSIPIGSQLPLAVGLAFAERHLGRDRVVLCYCGDGATSQGDFHESLTFAGVWKTPTVFYVQNNQWALSTPRDAQCAAPSFAGKAAGYGFAGVQVDGNDVTAVHQVVREAVRRARAGEGPTLIEGITYRVGAHTTTDDPSRYRTREEERTWERHDPVRRLQQLLLDRGLLTEADTRSLVAEARTMARKAFEEVESAPDPDLEAGFRHTFAEIPPVLQDQLARLRELRGDGCCSDR
jgi:pyruvate dehydrogenase E1 component alpha subunit